jgi:hypothetical protein
MPTDQPQHLVNPRLFYGEGKEDDLNLDGSIPPGVITRGVQAIIQNHREVGVEVVSCSDYYVFEDGSWRGVDIFGLFDFLLDSGIVLFGRTIKRDEFNQVMKRALDYQKNGLLGTEEKRF